MEKSGVLDLLIEFGGGAELLFGNVKKHKVQLQQEKSSKWTIRKLLPWIQENLLKERPELFIQDDSVRPGILVLVNDADWELLQLLADCEANSFQYDAAKCCCKNILREHSVHEELTCFQMKVFCRRKSCPWCLGLSDGILMSLCLEYLPIRA